MSHPFRSHPSRFLALISIVAFLVIATSYRPMVLSARQQDTVVHEVTASQEDTVDAPC